MANPQKENGYTAISNEILENIIKYKFPKNTGGVPYRICFFIMRKTYGYQKKSDHISLTQFEKALGVSRPVISYWIKYLSIANILIVQKVPDKRGFIYKFNKDYEQWLLLVNPLLLVVARKYTSKVATTNTSKVATTHKRKKKLTKEITETKVSNKKTMKNSFKYNENKHTDAFEDVVDYETNEVPKKAQKIITQFNLEKELEKMEQEENSYQDIVAIFIREKKLPIENISQLRVVQYRHTKDAKILSGAYTNEQIFKAIDEIKKELKDVDWTLGTVLKILTK